MDSLVCCSMNDAVRPSTVVCLIRAMQSTLICDVTSYHGNNHGKWYTPACRADELVRLTMKRDAKIGEHIH
jgi:hypothetical protein